MYGIFCKIVLHNETDYTAYTDKSNSIAKTLEFNRKTRTNEEQIYSQNLDTLVVTINGELNALGTIELINKKIEDFGYERAELIGYNVSQIIPDMIAAEHDQFLLRFLKTGESLLLGKTRLVFIKCKNGLIVPAHIYMRSFPSIE